MKTKKIKFSATNNGRYIISMDSNDYSGRMALHRINGSLPKNSELTPEDMKFVKKKPDVILQFPSIESLEIVINAMIRLRRVMSEKKGINTQYNNVEIESITPEKAIQMIRSDARRAKGRTSHELRPFYRTLEKIQSSIKTLEKMVEEKPASEPLEKDKITKAEPAENTSSH